MKQRRRHNRLIIGFLSLGLLAGAALTASPAQAAVSGPGPYYPAPAWDQKKGAGRFVVLTNWDSAAVLDKETGLVWERSTSLITAQTWITARFACLNKVVSNRTGWRLPSIVELMSLVDRSVMPGLVLPTGHPFTTVQSANYWSATTFADVPSDAWFVNFGNGNVGGNGKTFNGQIWCVRGGMNAEAY